MEQTIDLICNECCELFSVEMIEGLNMVSRHEDFADPILCLECCPSARWAQEEYGGANEG